MILSQKVFMELTLLINMAQEQGIKLDWEHGYDNVQKIMDDSLYFNELPYLNKYDLMLKVMSFLDLLESEEDSFYIEPVDAEEE